MAREVRREEIDYTIFVSEAEFYLAQVRGGCPGGEREALELTIANYGGSVTEDDVRGWSRDPAFVRTLKHARAISEENRAYDARRAAAKQTDPFRLPPRPGQPDLALEVYDTNNPPGALRAWAQRVRARMLAQPPREEPATSPRQRFILATDLTAAQQREIAMQQAAEAAQRADERQAQEQHGFVEQPWNGRGLSPDGSRW